MRRMILVVGMIIVVYELISTVYSSPTSTTVQVPQLTFQLDKIVYKFQLDENTN